MERQKFLRLKLDLRPGVKEPHVPLAAVGNTLPGADVDGAHRFLETRRA